MECRGRLPRPADEQAQRRRLVRRVVRLGQGERREGHDGFAGNPQGRPAGDQEPQRGQLPDEDDQVRCGAQDLLEVVQHDQQRPVAQQGGYPFDRINALGGFADGRGDGRQDHGGIIEGCQRDEDGVQAGLTRGDPRQMAGKVRFADAARTGNRHQLLMLIEQQRAEPGDLGVPADQRGRMRRQTGHPALVSRAAGRCAGRFDCCHGQACLRRAAAGIP